MARLWGDLGRRQLEKVSVQRTWAFYAALHFLPKIFIRKQLSIQIQFNFWIVQNFMIITHESTWFHGGAFPNSALWSHPLRASTIAHSSNLSRQCHSLWQLPVLPGMWAQQTRAMENFLVGGTNFRQLCEHRSILRKHFCPPEKQTLLPNGCRRSGRTTAACPWASMHCKVWTETCSALNSVSWRSSSRAFQRASGHSSKHPGE